MLQQPGEPAPTPIFVEQQAPDAAAGVKEEAADDCCDDESAAEEEEGHHGAKRRRVHADDALSMPKEAVRKIAREMLLAARPDARLDRDALRALHVAVEAYAVDVFATAGRLVALAGRTTVPQAYLAEAADAHARMRVAALASA